MWGLLCRPNSWLYKWGAHGTHALRGNWTWFPSLQTAALMFSLLASCPHTTLWYTTTFIRMSWLAALQWDSQMEVSCDGSQPRWVFPQPGNRGPSGGQQASSRHQGRVCGGTCAEGRGPWQRWRKSILYFRFYDSCSYIHGAFLYPLTFSPGSLPVGK